MDLKKYLISDNYKHPLLLGFRALERKFIRIKQKTYSRKYRCHGKFTHWCQFPKQRNTKALKINRGSLWKKRKYICIHIKNILNLFSSVGVTFSVIDVLKYFFAVSFSVKDILESFYLR